MREDHGDGVAGVDARESLGQGLDGAVLGRAPVPALDRPPLRDVFKLAGILVQLGADDGGDGLVVGDAACAVGAVAVAR